MKPDCTQKLYLKLFKFYFSLKCNLHALKLKLTQKLAVLKTYVTSFFKAFTTSLKAMINKKANKKETVEK